MKRFLQNLFLISGFVLTAFAALAQPTFSSATTTTTTNIRVTFTAASNLSGIPGGFAGFTVTGATISAASIVGGAGNSKQVDLTVSALAPNFTCTNCVAVAANTVTDGALNGAIAAAGNGVTDGIIPVITSVSIPNSPMNVNDVVTATIIVNSDADAYTLGGSTIGGFPLGGLNKTNNTTYTATFTITNPGTDVAAGSNIPISVVLQDTGGNNSTPFVTAIAQGGDPIDANNPVITAVTIPNAPMNVLDVVTATITVTNDGGDLYTLPGGSTIGGFALGSLIRTNSTTYTATFTIANGGTDVAAGSNIPVSVILNDGATNVSNTFTTAIAQGGDPIDANNPVITAVTIPDAAMNVLDVVTATITVTNDGGDTYTLPGGSTIGGFALGSLNRTNSTTYTATFLVAEGGTDVAAGANIPISVTLQDGATNSSGAFTTAIVQANDPIDANSPVITAVSIPDVAMKVGDVVTATITVNTDADNYTLPGGSTINGYALGSLNKTNSTTYTATFTITTGGIDRAAGATIPISITLQDGAGNNSNNFTAAITQANDPIDANNPSFTSVLPSPSTGFRKIGDAVQVNFTATGAEATLVAGAALTVNGVDVSGTFTNLGGGNYRVTYTVGSGNTDRASGTLPLSLQINDAAGNSTTIVAFTAANTLVIDATAPVVSAVSIPNVTMKVGDVVTATITVANDGGVTYTLPGGSTIGGFALGGLLRTNSTTYTATFTVTNAGTDVPAGSDIPVSITLNDPAGNASNNFITAISQGGDRIDANRPVITAVSIPDVNMKVGDVVTATITVNTDVDIYTLPGGSTIGGFVLGGLVKSNNTTYTATFTITTGGTDVAAGSNIPVNVALQDTGGNNNSPAFTTAIVQAGDRIDANNPAVQLVGSVITTGGTIRAGYWNGTNSGVNIQVPINTGDASLATTGTIQIQAKVSTDVSWTSIGTPHVIAALTTPRTVSLSTANIETDIPNFAENVTLQFRAITTDVAGNSTIQTQSATTLLVDQVAPTISGAPRIYFDAVNDDGTTNGSPNKETVIFEVSEAITLADASAVSDFRNDGGSINASGTISVSNSDKTVTGTGTNFTTTFVRGQGVFTSAGVKLGEVASITDNLSLELFNNGTSNYSGNYRIGVGVGLSDGSDDGRINSDALASLYFNSFSPAYASPTTFTRAVRIISRDGTSNWGTSSQLRYVPGGNLVDLAGNEFTMALTNIVSGSSSPPTLNPDVMTLFPRSGNPEKISFTLGASLGQSGILDGTGTITSSTLSTTVTGTGTAFDTELVVGQQLWDANSYHYIGRITAIGSATSLTLSANALYALTNAPFSQSQWGGTISATTASTTVTGVATLFTTQMSVGQEIWDITGTQYIGTIASITSNTVLELGANAANNITTAPYIGAVNGFTSNPIVPFAAIYTEKGTANRISLLAQANGAFTTGSTISYTSAGNALGTNGVELPNITNHVVIMETQGPVVTSVSIPNTPMKVGDVVIATITTQDDDGDNVTLTTGALNGFALGGLVNVSGTTKTASFTIVEGGADLAAGSNVAFSTNLVLTDSSVPTASAPFSTAIVQANDRIDANSPRVLSINRQTTVNNGAPSFGTSSPSAVFRITFSEDISGPTLTAADFAIRMKGIGTGTITSSTATTAVTGVGTLFTSQLAIGNEIWDRTGTILVGTVASITDDTNLTLTLNAGTTLAATPWSSPAITSLTAASITGISAVTGTSVFDVTVANYIGLGVLGIDYIDNNDANAVLDIVGNGTITSLGNPDGDFAGQTYQIVLPQPSTHVTAFVATATALNNYSLKLDWTGTSTGATNYLIIARGLTDVDAAGTYPGVADKTAVPDDTDFTDGAGAINISSALNTYTFTTLLSGKSYDFTIIPYALSPNNTSDNIDFFSAAAPTVNGTFTNTALATTLTAGSTAAPLAISSLTTAFGAKNFTFRITDDDGVNGIDNARTRFTQLVISAAPGNTVANWNDVIQEAELRTVTETTTILASGGSIGASSITFTTSTADNAEGEVDDNEVKEYELRIRLKNPMTGTAPQNVDGQVFIFQATAAGFSLLNTPSRSSQFGATESENSGAGTTVDVVATRFSFTAGGSVQPPATAFVLTNLTTSPIARAVDINGNTDKGYVGAVTITNTGSLPMTSASLPIAAGIIAFPAGFQYADDGVFAVGNGTLTVSDGSILNGSSSSVTVSYSNTSTITAGATGEPVSISSLTTVSPGTQVFDFTINEDFGAAGDGSNSRISQIIISQGTGNDIATWTQALPINGAVLSDGVNSIVGTVGATTITFSGIDVSSLGLINDGTSKTYRLNVWLNAAMGGALPTTVDNLNLVFEVLQANVTTTNFSSTIAPAESENSGSTNNAVAVIASKMDFTTSPAATLLPNKALSLQLPIPVVEARDANNNRDLDYNSTTIAVSNAGTIPMSNVPATNSMTAGILTFSGTFQYNNVGNGTLTVATTTLNAAAGTPTSAISTAVSVQAGSATTITAGGSGSPTIASTVNTVGAAVPVFNFTVNDDPVGTPPAQDDGNPTLITQMVITQVAPNAIADWTQAIAGAVLTDGTFSTPVSGTVTINPTNITISGISTVIAKTGTLSSSTASNTVTGVGTSFTTQLAVGQILYDAAGTTRIGTIGAIGGNTNLTLTGNANVTLAGSGFSTANLGLVADGASKTFTLRIFLNSTLGGTLPITIDGLAFGFEVLSGGVSTNLNGTQILAAQAQNSGANNVVSVTATKLTFVQLDGADGFAFPANPWPANADINSPFTPRLGMEARDVNNNRDLGFIGAITAFTVNNSLGTSNNPSGAFTAGTLKFPSLIPATSFFYTSGDNQDGALTVTAGGVTSTSPPINVRSSQDAYVYFDDTGYTPLISSATQQVVSMPATANATVAILAKLILSDGGASNFEATGTHAAINDGDGAFTRISQISFAVTNSQDLRTLALYNSAGTKISSDVSTGPVVNFTGLNIQAPDNGTIDFTVRASFASTITADHDLVQLTVTGVTHNSGSLLYQGATPPNVLYKGGILNGDQTLGTANRIDVVATKLVFTQNPPTFAGRNEPVPYSGTPVIMVAAQDANNNLDVDFTGATRGDISSSVALVTNAFFFNAGILDLTSLRYDGVGNGTLTVSATVGLPFVIEGGPGPVIASPSNAISTNVDVVHVTAGIATGGIVPGPTANLAGGAVDRKIFGVTFNAPYQASTHPDLTSFVIGFGLPPGIPITDILTNFRVYENTSGTFGGPNITSLTGTITPINSNQELRIQFGTPRDLSTPKSYFLEVDVITTASGSTPPIQPQIDDDGFGTATETNIVTTRGSAKATVTGNIYNFSAIFPPSLEGSYPASGQLNVATNQPKLSLNFSVPVWTLNKRIYLWDQTAGGPAVALAVDSTSAPIDPGCLCRKNGLYSQSAGGTIDNQANPVIFNLPGALIADHVYYLTVDPGVFNGPAAPNNRGFMDEAGNLFPGISYPGTLYFKTTNPNPPNMLSTPVAASNPDASGTIVGGTISATFDQRGRAYYLVLPVAAGTPTPDQITGIAAHGSTIAKGSFRINQVNPISQFGTFAPQVVITAGTTYNVWMSATSESLFSPTGLVADTVRTQVPIGSPQHFGSIAKITKTGSITTALASNIVTGVGTLFTSELLPGRTLFDGTGTNLIGTIASITSNTSLVLATNAQTAVAGTFQASGFQVGAAGPTLTFVPAVAPAVLEINQPSLSICTNSYQVLSQPITISESSAGNNFSGGSQSFNLVLPAGFEFDISMNGITPVYGNLTLIGSDFVGAGSLSFIGSSILKVNYQNSGSGSIDKIIISGLRVRSGISTSGQIVRFGGNGIPSISDLDPVATISAAAANGISFYNSYSVQTFNNTAVTTIPDNFEDPTIAQPLVTQLFPQPPFGDYGASSFSGPGVNVNLLNLTAVSLGTPFNITINHTDNNGCPSESQEQYTVYDSRTAIADLNTVYCSRNDQFTISNPTALATTGRLVNLHRVTFNKLQSYYLDGLTADIPVTATDPDDGIDSIRTDQIIFGLGWKNLLNKGIATGTIVVDSLTNTVTGTGTLFTTQLRPGTELYNSTGTTLLGVVRTIGSNTSLTLTENAYRNLNGQYSRSWLLSRILYPPGSTQNSVLIGPAGGYLPLNNPLPGPPAHEYFDYIFDEATIMNAKFIEPGISKNPYDYSKQASPQGNVYYTGGSLGIVQFTGIFQSIANASVRIPLLQNVRFFLPAVPIIETSPASFIETTDVSNLPGPGNPGAPAIPTVGPGGAPSSNKGTLVFCQLGGDIQISAYPAASPGSSLGRFTVVDHTDTTQILYDKPPGGTFINNPGFVDNTNGTATIDPTLLTSPLGIANNFRTIRIIYTYKENTSPCESRAKQVIRISPNPVADFTFQSTAGSFVVDANSKCAGEPITFISSASSSDPINPAIIDYRWSFGDPTSSENLQNGAIGVFPAGFSQLPHTFASPSAPGLPYVVTHEVRSTYQCLSVTPAALTTIGPRQRTLDVGQRPVVNFSLTGVALGDTFEFISRDGLNNTTTSANDAIKQYTWTYGPGASPTTNVLDVTDGLITNADFNAHVENVMYTTIGQKTIDLEVQTVLGCKSTLSLQPTSYRDIIVLDTTYFSSPTDVYDEDFNASDGNWQVWGTGNTVNAMVANIPSASWGHGKIKYPFSGDSTLYVLYRGANAWKTNPSTNGTYNVGEKSALYSHRFNLAQLLRPMISFNSIVQTGLSDGVVLQFSTDTLNIADPRKKWKTLGSIGDGQFWFNQNAIAGSPGDQTQDDLGWSGTDSEEWIAPKRTLDIIGGSTRAVFRFALGVAGSPNIGFFLDNVRIGDRTRTILLESFANTANGGVEKTEADAVADFQDGAVGTEVVKLNYHVNFPGRDPFNEDNPADPSSRALFYNITTTPRSILDGEKGPSDLFSNWGQAQYDLRSLQLAQADITITPTVNADGTINIEVDVKSNVLTGIKSNTVLHVVVMEQDIAMPLTPSSSENTAKQALINSSLGYTSFEYVVKKMVPSAAGTPFGAELPFNGIRHFPEPGQEPLVWKPEASKLYGPSNDIAIAVFLQQTTAPYEIFQVELVEPIVDPPVVTGLEMISPEDVLVYPNPANHEMTVKMPGQLTKSASMNMIDLNGRISLQSSIPEGSDRKTLNVSDLASGVYILQIDMGSGVLTRKKVIIVHQD